MNTLYYKNELKKLLLHHKKNRRHDTDPDRLHADGDLPPSRWVRVMSYIINKVARNESTFFPLINKQLISKSVITAAIVDFIQHIRIK